MSQKSFKDIVKKLDKLLSDGKYDEVRSEAKKFLRLNPEGINNRLVAAAFFVDCSVTLNDFETAQAGIDLFIGLIEEESNQLDERQHSLKYNLANGYMSKAKILYKSKQWDEAEKTRRLALVCFQKLLLNRERIETTLLASILTNYANLLDGFGRSIEAIDYYVDALKLTPNPNAYFNCGSVIRRILGITQDHLSKNIIAVLEYFQIAEQMKTELVDIAGTDAANALMNELNEFHKQVDISFENGLADLIMYKEHRLDAHAMPITSEWMIEIVRDRLLLSLNLMPLESVDECKDDLYFQSYKSDINEDNEHFTALVNILNTVKEDFATARYFYYLSRILGEREIAEVSSITSYGKDIEASDFGLGYGIKKASFRLAADCFDKLAIFMNKYLYLGHSETNVNFNNVWFVDRNFKKGLHPTVEVKFQNNQFLKALWEMKQDWFAGDYPKQLKKTRNALTHNRLPLYWIPPSDKQDNIPVWDVDEFPEATLMLLRMVKAAIIYLVCMVTLEENHKNKDANDNLTVPLNFNLGKSFTDDQLTRAADQDN